MVFLLVDAVLTVAAVGLPAATAVFPSAAAVLPACAAVLPLAAVMIQLHVAAVVYIINIYGKTSDCIYDIDK